MYFKVLYVNYKIKYRVQQDINKHELASVNKYFKYNNSVIDNWMPIEVDLSFNFTEGPAI